MTGLWVDEASFEQPTVRVTVRHAFAPPYARTLDFADPAAAVAACQRLVDDFLTAHAGLSAYHLRELAEVFSDDPDFFDPALPYNTFVYRRHRCDELGSPTEDPGAFQRAVNALLERVEEPVVATVPNPASHSADDVDRWIHVVNLTRQCFWISTRADFFATVNEETGEGMHVGPSPVTEQPLDPGTSLRVGEIRGWELDTDCGFEFRFRGEQDGMNVYGAMSLKSSPSVWCVLPVLNREARLFRGIPIAPW